MRLRSILAAERNGMTKRNKRSCGVTKRSGRSPVVLHGGHVRTVLTLSQRQHHYQYEHLIRD